LDSFRQLHIIWLALTGGLAAWTVVAFGLLTLGTIGLGAFPAGVMPYVAAGVLAFMAAGLVVRRRGIASIPRDASEGKRFERYLVATILGLAMVEGGALVLITVSIVADTPGWALAGGAAGVWMLLMARPRREDMGSRPPRP